MSRRLLIAVTIAVLGTAAFAAARLRTQDCIFVTTPTTEVNHRAKWLFGADGAKKIPDGVTLQIKNGLILGVFMEEGVANKEAWNDLLGTRYAPGDLDGTDVTRQLWREVRLRLGKPDGSIAKIELLRPLWWFDETGAEVGTVIDMAVHEIDLEGDAEILSIGPCVSDSREGSQKSAIVIGRIQHEGAVVWDLVFDGDNENPLGVTANHPLFSFDRDEWVPAGELEIDEKVDTIEGTATLTSKTKRPGLHTVYNLEVHRTHTYRVTERGILAHNTGIGCGLNRKFDGSIHHIATNRDKVFKPRFESLFKRAGMNLESPWNRMRLEGHVGPHGSFYNYVLQRLESAVGTKTGQAARTALVAELKALRRDIRHNGLDALLKARASHIDVLGNF